MPSSIRKKYFMWLLVLTNMVRQIRLFIQSWFP